MALFFGVIAFFAAKAGGEPGLPYLFGWIAFSLTTLFFVWNTILARHPKQTGSIARQQDSSVFIIFLIVVSAAFVSLFAIILLLRGLPSYSKHGLSLHIVLSMIDVGLSWLLIHSLFTIRYAHLYYNDDHKNSDGTRQEPGGLDFPKEPLPDFLDFAYFSFVLGMTFQTADVSITSRAIRRLALLHGFLSFIYNTAIIALSINIVSGLIGK